MPRFARFALLAVLVALAPPLAAQTTVTLPRIEEAETTFGQALDAFNAGDFGMAARRFALVYDGQPTNQKTTAALVLAGAARLREGDREGAAALLRRLLADFPSSSYADEARDLLARAEAPAPPVRVVHTLGVALPLTAQQGPLSQAFFNGLRLAVDEHNARAAANPEASEVRMVFRDTRNTEADARAAVESLRSADAVVGPLFSDEALGAGAGAEAVGVPLVVPLATDDRVAAGRRFVFQINPPLSERGTILARFAKNRLRLDTLGTAYDSDVASSQRLARSFAAEGLRLGATVPVQQALTRGWASVVQAATPDALAPVQALYLPVSGSNAEVDIRVALSALTRAGLRPVILGDAEWAGRAAARSNASRFRIVFANDFVLDEGSADLAVFRDAYRRRFGTNLVDAGFTPQRLAVTGYDLGRYLIDALDAKGNRPLADVLARRPAFDGLGIRVEFDGGRVNEGLVFQQYTADGRTVPAR